MRTKKETIIELLYKIYGLEDSLKGYTAVENTLEHIEISAEYYLFGITYHCELTVNKNNEKLSSHCDCHWYEDHQQCPHINMTYQIMYESHHKLALPIKYENKRIINEKAKIEAFSNRKELRMMNEKSKFATELLNQFVTIYDTQLQLSVDEMRYEIKPVFTDKFNDWELSFKVGREKKYVIKSIRDFLQNIDERKLISYGKQLSFIHSEEMFDEVANNSIRFMRKHIVQFQMPPLFDLNTKVFKLQSALLDEFYETYENYEDVDFVLETISCPMEVSVTKKDMYYIVHLDTIETFHIGAKHIYYLQESDKISYIFRMLLDEEGIGALFIQQLQLDDIVIAENNYPKFYKYVLLNVMQYMKVSLPTILEDERMDHAELYGDMDEKNRIFFYLYCYNEANVRYNGFDSSRITTYEQDMIESYIRKYATHIDEEHHLVYMDENEDSTLNFISEGLPYLSKYCEIYVSEALKSIGKSQSYNIKIGVRFSNDLLTFDINSLDIPKEELAAVLTSYKKKKKFFRLKNGKLLSLQSDDLEELSTFLDTYHVQQQDIMKGKFSMDSYRMFSVEQSIKNQSLLQINREKSFVKHLSQYFEAKKHPLPKRFDSILRDYQKEGFQWLSIMRQYNFNGILADDMGLGKTIQVIALLEANKSEKCSIVICPASLMYNWEDEIHKFTDGISLICVTGTQEERLEKIHHHTEVDVLITSYDYIRRDIAYYEDITFDTVILDEAQYIKNQKTKNASCVKQLQGLHKIALTGTPIENSLAELWSIFDFLMPDYLFNYHYFQKHYENDIIKNKDSKKQQALRHLVSPFILRRNKKDVLKELPDKTEVVRMIEFNEEERKLYQANVALISKELQLMGDAKNNKLEILALLTKLRQICCEPRLLYENIDSMSSKLTDCIMLIQELHENHQKVLLFSTFTSILDLIAVELKRKQISYYMLTGKTNKENRKDIVKKFQNDDTSVFLISLKAGGTGLNLTAAEAVIHFDPWWNQSAQNQATDRAYRIGQNKNVQVFKMIMKDSLEEKICKLQDQKKELADAFVENNDGKITSMSKEEILELFSE